MAEAMSGGTVFNVISPLVEGFSADRAARYEAKQIDAQSKSVSAQGQRRAREIGRQTESITGQAIAAQVASGGTASDAQAIRQQARIQERGDFNALAAIFESEEQAKGLRAQANAKRFEGEVAKRKGKMKALSNAMGSFAQAGGG